MNRPHRAALIEQDFGLNPTASASALVGRAIIEAIDAQAEAALEQRREFEQRAEERHRELLYAIYDK